MKIEHGKVAIIHYSLKNEAGDTIDSTQDQDPMGYLHGHNNLMPGLEAALEGKGQGDKFSVNLAPEDAFGPHNKEQIQEVPKEQFADLKDLTPGMHLQVKGPQGTEIVTVVTITDDTVTVDFNHPLAGQTLLFEIEVMDVREATEEEVQHGHVHGHGGCGH